MDSLWGDEFKIEESPEKTKKLLNKVKNPKKPQKVVTVKSLKSKTVSIGEKLSFITQNVLRILGVYKENTQVIKTKEELIRYIDAAISNGIIAVDTETNNSLEPITCKLMGPCIYTPGQKNAYIPINHVDVNTNERLDWQLTEEDVAEQLKRLSDTKIIFHNGKFDYQVIKCTTGVELDMYWDTLIGAKILDENERAGLKQQYIQKIDPSIEKYDIEHLFEGIEYAVVDPEIFALYAATDAFMTYKLYLWQLQQFEKPENKRIFEVFKNIEMPVITVAAEMELSGVSIDIEYSKRLSEKYHKQSDALDIEMNKELEKYSSQIAQWRLTSDANYKPPKKTGEGLGKSKSEQLSDPVSLSSPTQLAILFYDVLGIKPVDKKSPRGTGEDILTKINDKYKIPLCDLILKKRGLEKLIGTYIDKLPACVCPKDNRLHAHFNQYGAGCVVGDTKILTNKGYINIKDIFDGTEENGKFYETDLTIVNRDLEYERASHKVVYYNYPTKKVTLGNGITIEGTYNHPIVCSSQKMKSNNLIFTDSVNYRTLSEVSVGDFVVLPISYHKFSTEVLISEDEAFEIGNKIATNKEINDLAASVKKISMSSSDTVLSFLRGICGFYTVTDELVELVHLKLHLTDNEVINTIMDLFLNVGICPIFESVDDILLITIPPSQNRMFHQLRHGALQCQLKRYITCPIKSIEDSMNTVYDLHVPDTHSFISNGIISHNTGRFSSSDPNL